MVVNYPNGAKPVLSASQRIRPSKSVVAKNHSKRLNMKRKHKSHKSKYMNKRNIYDGHEFDSKTERDYYIYLKACGIKCKCHPRYTVIPHTEYKSKVDGKTYKIRKRSYTPDFVLYDNKGNITEVDDVKGILHFPSYDRLRMNLFSLKYHIPITIVRRGRHHSFRKTNI